MGERSLILAQPHVPAECRPLVTVPTRPFTRMRAQRAVHSGEGPPGQQAALRPRALRGGGALPGRKSLCRISVHAPAMAPAPAVLTRLLCAGERGESRRWGEPGDPRGEDRDEGWTRPHRLFPRRCAALARFPAEGDPGPCGAEW